LREHPHRHALPRHGVKVSTVGHVHDFAQTVGKLARQHLVEHGFGLVQVLRRRDHLGNQLAVARLTRHGGGREHSAVQRGKGVGVLLDELGAGAKSTAGVAVPQILGQHMDETDFVEHRTLVERIGAQETIDVARTQVGHHLGWRDHTDLHIGVGVQAAFGQVIAQQKVVHRIVKGHAELEALPVLGIAVVLVLHGQRDGLPVDVLNGRHIHGRGIGTQAHADGQGHG
jgi:hypothetical protein